MKDAEKATLRALVRDWRSEANSNDRPYGDGLLTAANALETTLDRFPAERALVVDTVTRQVGYIGPVQMYERAPNGDGYRYQLAEVADFQEKARTPGVATQVPPLSDLEN